jgi:enamine deaminase RidA (YjgF/YER057c/UK114 family)
MTWDVRYGSEAAAQTVAVGNVVFVSGCTCVGPGAPVPRAVEDQVELALESTRSALEAAGSRLENVVKTFFLLTSLDDYGRVRRTETEFYERHAPQLVTTPPAATLMVVPSLGPPELLVQYEVIAALDRAMPGWPVTYYPEHWAGRELAYPHVPKEHAKFARSQSIGNLLLVSGCQALDHDTVRVETADVGEQSRIVLDKITVAVEETGGTLGNLLKTNVFVKDVGALATYREVERRFLREHDAAVAEHPPASTAFVVTELPRPEFLIEVEAFAVAGAAPPGWSIERRPGTPAAAESVTAGQLVFLSACRGLLDGGRAPASVDDEVSTALGNVRDALARAGSAVANIVKITLMLTDAANYAEGRRALLAFYADHAPRLLETPPATTFMVVAAIAPAGARVQVDVVAVR